MRFARYGTQGSEIPVLLEGERAFDLRGITPDIDGTFLAQDGPARVRSAHAAGSLLAFNTTGLRVGAPIARPSAVFCIGMNYVAHAAETGSPPPKNMVMFMKAPNTVVGPNDPVRIPRGSTRTDWEVELGIVIGRRASYLETPAASRDHIAGYVLANDLSERTWQIDVSGGQWCKGKSGPGFCPTGPWLATADEVNADDLGLRSFVNGEPRQDSRTSDFIFGIDHIVHELSQVLVLEPGDLILTGTPAGVALSGKFPYLAPGDVVELDIEGLGSQRQEVIAS